MPELIFSGEQYRLRAGSPMPVRGLGEFILQTFMAEKNVIETLACTEDLPASSAFRGQGGELISASFSRLGAIGGTLFNGRRVYSPTYIDEDEI